MGTERLWLPKIYASYSNRFSVWTCNTCSWRVLDVIYFQQAFINTLSVERHHSVLYGNTTLHGLCFSKFQAHLQKSLHLPICEWRLWSTLKLELTLKYTSTTKLSLARSTHSAPGRRSGSSTLDYTNLRLWSSHQNIILELSLFYIMWAKPRTKGNFECQNNTDAHLFHNSFLP